MQFHSEINYNDKIIYEFKDLYNDSRYGKYYTFSFAAVTLLEIIVVALMNRVRMGQYLCLLFLEIGHVIFIIVVKPFKFRLNNLKAILMRVLMVVLFVINIALVGTKTYIYELELVGVIAVCVVLAINVILTICQIINSYSAEIYEWFKPCIMKFRHAKKTKFEPVQNQQSLLVENLDVPNESEPKPES